MHEAARMGHCVLRSLSYSFPVCECIDSLLAPLTMLSPRRSPLLLTCMLACVLLLALSSAPLRSAAVGKKLSAKQLEAIEDQWMEDEVEDEDDTPFKYTKTADGGRMPPQPSGPKTEMAFVTVRESNRANTDKLAGRWADQMTAGGIDTRGYTIEDNRILYVCDQRGFKDMNKVRTFLLRQPEVLDFEWNSKKSLPGDVPATDDEPAAAADPMSQFQAMQDEQAMKAKREKKRAKKEAEARKAKKKREQAAKAKAKKQKEQAKQKAEAEAQKAAQQQQQQAATGEQQQQQQQPQQVEQERTLQPPVTHDEL